MPTIPAVEIATNDVDLERKNGLFYLKNELFSGTIIEKYPNDQIKKTTACFKGERFGKMLLWYADGRLAQTRFYRKNQKHGTHKGFWPNGEPKFVYHFINGKYEGEYKEWHSNGKLFKLQHFENGIEIGSQQAWEATGKVKFNYVVREGRRYGLVGTKTCEKVENPYSKNEKTAYYF